MHHRSLVFIFSERQQKKQFNMDGLTGLDRKSQGMHSYNYRGKVMFGNLRTVFV